MGTCNLPEKKIKNFWCDTLSSFCRNILKFKDECCVEGDLYVTLDKKTCLKLNINTTLAGQGDEQPQRNEKPRESDTSDSKNVGKSGGYNTTIVPDPVSGIHNFLSDTLSSFCKNMIEFRTECTIQGKLCITIDKENAMLVEIQETVHAEEWVLLTELLNDNSAATSNQSITVPNGRPPVKLVSDRPDHKATSPIVISPELESNPEGIKQSSCTTKETNFVGRGRHGAEPVQIQTDSKLQTDHNLQVPDKRSSSKRKRKQANPVSLRSLESTPKVIVIQPDDDTTDMCTNEQCPPDFQQPKEKLRKCPSAVGVAESTMEQNISEINKHSYFLESQFPINNSISTQVPLMVHLLQQQTLAHLSATKKSRPDGDLSNLPALVSKASPLGNLDVLAERVSMAYSNSIPRAVPTTVTANEPMQVSPYMPASPTNNPSSDSETTPSKSRSKTRYVNSLSDVPDDEVQQMLMALVTSGQTKIACDAKQCSICCPTLAYIRFRDRNRKNKSRFCMDKIEQVVNVKQYGGGSKYRDVQRMFTTHLRKLRAKHMCDKKCHCCEKLLLRESKKPNSNYLPHNVVPYKNLQKGRSDLDREDGAKSPICT